jgi:hypothetical protein
MISDCNNSKILRLEARKRGKIAKAGSQDMHSARRWWAWGRAVEVNGRNHYFRGMLEYCDDQMRQVMEATNVDGPALKESDGLVVSQDKHQNMSLPRFRSMKSLRLASY